MVDTHISSYKELRDALKSSKLGHEVVVTTSLGFLAALWRQAQRNEVQRLTEPALTGLTGALDPFKSYTQSELADVAQLAVKVAEATAAELDHRGHGPGS